MAGDGQIQNMTNRERLWGGVLLAAYLWPLPLCADPASPLAGRRRGGARGEAGGARAYP